MAQNLRQRSDLENGSTEALSESRASLSEWQTDPELKFYGRAMSYENGIDRVVRPIAYLMLEAHWMYWTAGIGRFLLPETSTTLGDARPSLGRQRTIKHWLGLFGHRSKSEKALASQTSPRSPKTIPRVATP